jgi:arginine decarboxylase
MTAKTSKRIDQFLLMHSARADQWRGIAIHAEDWSEVKTGRPALEEAIEAIAPAEGFFAYPGPALFGALRERVAADDAAGALKLARRISNALLTRAYHDRPGEWDGTEDGVGSDAPAVFRSAVRQQPARLALASAGQRAATAAPAGRPVRL